MGITVLTFLLFLSTTSAFVIPENQPENHSPSLPQTPLTGRALVEHINTVQSSWVAEDNEMSEAEMKFKVMDPKYVESIPKNDKTLIVRKEMLPETLPKTFDARQKWPNCQSIKIIHDQATCGSCWAVSTAEIISDRICIQSNGTQQPIISAQDILTCCGDTCGYGCKGGNALKALEFWNSKGAVTGGDYHGDGCMPYSFAPCNKAPCPDSPTPSCKTTCQSSYKTAKYNNDKHYGSTAYGLSSSVAAIQTEIYRNGPVVALFEVYDDFYKYKSGVYHYVYGKMTGNHLVKILGWGTENGDDYWLIANSWGTTFGQSGFFKMRRGTNEVGIEGAVVAGIAKLGSGSSPSSYGFVWCTLTLLVYYFI